MLRVMKFPYSWLNHAWIKRRDHSTSVQESRYHDRRPDSIWAWVAWRLKFRPISIGDYFTLACQCTARLHHNSINLLTQLINSKQIFNCLCIIKKRQHFSYTIHVLFQYMLSENTLNGYIYFIHVWNFKLKASIF